MGIAFVPAKGPPPNWRETQSLAKRQDKLLRQTTRALAMAIATMNNDLYATRVANAMAYIEDAFDELKDDYLDEDEHEIDNSCCDFKAEFRDAQLAAQELKR